MHRNLTSGWDTPFMPEDLFDKCPPDYEINHRFTVIFEGMWEVLLRSLFPSSEHIWIKML